MTQNPFPILNPLVEFTLNTKYTKNPHENIFKTQQYWASIKTNGCPNDWD
jgi:hypothetical protein